MSTIQEYRAKAADCGELAKQSLSISAARRLRERRDSYLALADNEDWLAQHAGAYYSNTREERGYELVVSPDQNAVTVVLSGSDHGEVTGPTRLVFGQPMVIHSPRPGVLSIADALAMGATFARDLGVRLVVIDPRLSAPKLFRTPASRAA